MIIPVTIGLEPGNAENAVDPFNLGTINPVGMTAFSTAQLDAQTIDPATVELGSPSCTPRFLPKPPAAKTLTEKGPGRRIQLRPGAELRGMLKLSTKTARRFVVRTWLPPGPGVGV